MLSVQSQNKKNQKVSLDFSDQIKGFPLEMDFYSQSDNQKMTVKISNLEIGFVDPEVFILPDNCEVTDLTQY